MSARRLFVFALAVLGLVGPAAAQSRRPPLAINACAGGLSHVAYWTNLLRAPDAEMRIRAARNLGEARSEDAVRALTEALKDPDLDVRAEAARALERIRRAR